MKISKLLLLGMLVTALAVPAFASDIQMGKDIVAGDPPAYLVGDTVHFVVTVTNPGDNDHTNTLTDIWDVLPDGSTVWLVQDGVDPPLVQAPGDVEIYYVNYVVAAADLIPLGAGYTGVRNFAYCNGYDSDAPPEDVGADTSKSAIVRTPGITLDKSGDAIAFCVNGEVSVTYTYLVENTGDEDLEDILVADDRCISPAYDSGDDGDGLLNPDEIWTYECTMLISETTLNLAKAEGYGVETGAKVLDFSEWEVVAVEPPDVSVDLDPAEICDGESSLACADVDPDDGNYEYSWTKDGVPIPDSDVECIEVTEAAEYCVHVLDLDSGCDADACATLIVNEGPSCEIEIVEPPVCPSPDGNYLTVLVTGGTSPYSYAWEVTAGEGWEILVGGDTDTANYAVGVDASDCATFMVTVTDDNGCETTCEIEVCCTGNTFCGFTQGFYGNAGGKSCGGLTTTEIINAALTSAGGSIVIGLPGNSIEFNSAQCIIALLPAGGKAKAIRNEDWLCTALHNSMLKKGRSNNVAIGQAVALTLNILLDGCVEDASPLGSFVIPEGDFCTVEEDGCPQKYSFPESVQGLTAAEVLADLNRALAGQATLSGATLGELSGAADGINNAFDECRTVVPCPTVEICDNGCDDDFDGLIDGDDIVDCPPIILP